MNNVNSMFRAQSFKSLQNYKTAQQQQRNYFIHSANENNNLKSLFSPTNLPPITKLSFEQAIQDDKELIGAQTQKKESGGKRMILLKKQMSETKLQEFKKRQIEKETERLREETVDNFLSPSKSKPGKDTLIVILTLVTAKILRQDENGRVYKRAILGTPEIFQQVQNKIKDNIEISSKIKKTVIGNPQIGHIQGVLKSNISTPQQRMFRIYKSTSIMENQAKGVAFQNKPLKRPSINITNQQFEEICNNIEERLNKNKKLENQSLHYLPFSIQLKQTQSQRILKQYDSIKNFWEKKKCQLAEKAGKPMSELGLMQSSDELRKKIEASEMIDKTLLNVETLGQTLWKANLRNYHKEANYKTLTKSFAKKSFITEEYIRKKALQQQQSLEQKETSKTFLNLQSLTQCADITSVYLDKSFKPTEIIRTPNFELSRLHQESLMNSQYLDNTNDQFNSTLKDHNLKESGTHIGQGWWNDTFKQSVIKEEEEEPNLFNPNESLKSTNLVKDTENIQNTNQSLNINTQDQKGENNPMSKTQLQKKSFNSTQSTTMNATSTTMNRKKKQTLDMLDQTLRQLKKSHSHLISPTNDEDAALLCVQGQNKLQMEVEAAKRIQGPKVLIPRESYMGEDIDGFRTQDEIIAINYDIKEFY